MKRIARTLAVVTLSGAAAAAVAADTPYPSSVQQEIPLSSEFPNMETYKQEHRNDAGQKPTTSTAPSSVPAETPLSSEFSNIRTYEDIHKNAPAARSTTPTYPYSVPAESSMSDEGLVPGVAGVPPADGGRGATR